MNDKDRARMLEAEIGKRDRLIRAFVTKDDGPRRGRKASHLQYALNVTHYPLTEFGMAEGRKIALPKTLADIAKTIGREGALRLAEGLLRQRTGKRAYRRQIYIPSGAYSPDHPVVACIGMEMAMMLQDEWANCIIEVPKLQDFQVGYRAHVAAKMIEAGETPEDVAACGVISKSAANQIASHIDCAFAHEDQGKDDDQAAAGGREDERRNNV
ncbi:hypothetical protein [Fuscibacter oryzae]|uniref:Uncharacterized protein n=1 Tax=Fuscibacter oryzae TaxID=2803939 RepID=A0A8J7MVL2_9RHOB|nr:hypothetical protein [Fuscibacter oryzae]MBL4929348.1 hypothetical protein [Fuscibacter oryzae]